MSFFSRFVFWHKPRHRGTFQYSYLLPDQATEIIEPVKKEKQRIPDEDQEFIDTLQMLKLEKYAIPHTTEVYAKAGNFERRYNLTIVLHGTDPDDSSAQEVWAYLLDQNMHRVDGFCTPVISTKHHDGFLDMPEEDWYVNWDSEDTVPIVIKGEEFRRALLELGYSREPVDTYSGNRD